MCGSPANTYASVSSPSRASTFLAGAIASRPPSCSSTPTTICLNISVPPGVSQVWSDHTPEQAPAPSGSAPIPGCGFLPDHRAGLAHLRNCPLAVAWMYIHAPDALLVDTYAKSGSQRVKRRVLHAIVGGEAADRHLVDPAVSQPALEPSGFE